MGDNKPEIFSLEGEPKGEMFQNFKGEPTY